MHCISLADRFDHQVLESKIEALRARVEEASSGSTGDAHAKLLRQVETLQTQYAIASENWQGIEGSLLARVANLEKERDELSKKESDIRRKAREMVPFPHPSQHTPSNPARTSDAKPTNPTWKPANPSSKTSKATS